LDVLILLLFTVWAIITILYQLEIKALKSINFFGFVPYCRFFAPNPTTTDIGIYYCGSNDEDISIEDEEWIPLVYEKKGLFQFYWNPNQRLNKTINTIVRQLSFLGDTNTNIKYTVPYLRLLNVSTEKVRNSQNANYVRFIITRHKGREESISRAIVFSSETHRVY